MLVFESCKDTFPHWEFGDDGKNSKVEHESQVRRWGSGGGREREEKTLSPGTHPTENVKWGKETPQQSREI